MAEADKQSRYEEWQPAEDRLVLEDVPQLRTAKRDASNAESRTDQDGKLRAREPQESEGEHAYDRERHEKPDHDRFQPAPGSGTERQAAKVVSRRKSRVAVKKGQVCVVDVRVVPGYDTNMSGAASAARR